MPRRVNRFRRATTVVVYWQKDRIVLENYFAGNRITANPLAVVLLDYFKDWRTLSEFKSAFSRYSAADLGLALRQLLKRRLLIREGSRDAKVDARFQRTWSSWLPAPGMLQFGTRHARYDSNLRAAWRRLRKRAEEQSAPSSVKHHVGADQVWLPPAQTSGTLPDVLLARRTWRRFSNASIPLQHLSTLLGLSWGVQRWVKFPGIGRLALKTSPSAGARHPIEAYVLATNVEGLSSGLYHYAADTHCLERLKAHATSQELVDFVGNQWWYASAAALILMTAVFARSQWKYQDSAAYRTVMIDAGHVCQTFCLLATWLDLAPFCTMAFDQTLVEKKLGIDGVEESLIYAAGVGTRPHGVDWAPWPWPRVWSKMAKT